MIFWNRQDDDWICPDCDYRVPVQRGYKSKPKMPPRNCAGCKTRLVTTPDEEDAYTICRTRAQFELSCKNCEFVGGEKCPLNWVNPLPYKVRKYIKRRVKQWPTNQT